MDDYTDEEETLVQPSPHMVPPSAGSVRMHRVIVIEQMNQALGLPANTLLVSKELSSINPGLRSGAYTIRRLRTLHYL